MNQRLKKLHARMKRGGVEALFLTSNANISYLTRYQSRDSSLLVTPGKSFFFTDARYTSEAKAFLEPKIQVIEPKPSLAAAISRICDTIKVSSLGFEEESISYAHYRTLKKSLNPGLALIPFKGLIESFRITKDSHELELIEKAVSITMDALGFAKTLLKPGITEREIASEIERFIRSKGAWSSAFETIVASGPNASFPHHLTSGRKLKENEAVTIDMGVDYKGYKSDLTRTYFIGRIPTLVQRIFGVTRSAQRQAIARIRPGITTKIIDSTARSYIAAQGFGRFFAHSLGHGVGLEVHEAPRISPKDSGILRPGMVFTVEPGIYLPGKCGVRIEDMVLVTKKGIRVLSGALNQ